MTHLNIFCECLNGKIPETVTHLTINSLIYKEKIIPQSVKHLTIKGNDFLNDKIPETVTYLTLDTLKNIKYRKQLQL